MNSLTNALAAPERKNSIIVIGGILIFCFGFLAHSILDKNLPLSMSSYKKGEEAGKKKGEEIGYASAKKVFDESIIGKISKSSSQDTKSFFGKVVSVEATKIVVKSQRSVSPFDTKKTQEEVTFAISPETKIVTYTTRTSAPKVTSSNGIVSIPVEEKTISLTSLKKDSFVTIKTAEDIVLGKTVLANKIISELR